MTETLAVTVQCPSCKFSYKKYTHAQTLVRACPKCGAEAPEAGGRKPAPKGTSRFIPRIPTGMVPKTDTDEAAAKKTGRSPTVETAAAAAGAGGIVPPMATPPPRSSPFMMPAPSMPEGVEIPVCFGDPEVFQTGEFCPTCNVIEKCYPRVLILTLNKLAGVMAKK